MSNGRNGRRKRPGALGDLRFGIGHAKPVWLKVFVRVTLVPDALRKGISAGGLGTIVIEKIAEFILLERLLSQTLDVGCGTGFSSVGLKQISESVDGCDLSAEMRNFAEYTNGVEYAVASGYLAFPKSR